MVHISHSIPYSYLDSVNFNEQLRIFCTCDKNCIDIATVFRIEVIDFKNSKFAQILYVDKTCFLRPGHISSLYSRFIMLKLFCYNRHTSLISVANINHTIIEINH